MYRINFIHEMLINNVKKKNNLHGTTCERKFRFEVLGCACCLSLEKIIFLEVFEIVINTKNFLMFSTARLNKGKLDFFFVILQVILIHKIYQNNLKHLLY